MQSIFAFVELYLAPFLLAVALMCLVYGVINYFVIGPGDEDIREFGRQGLLWCAMLATFAMVLFVVTQWMFNLVNEINKRAGVDSGVNTERRPGILPVPNVPTIRLPEESGDDDSGG